jgi:heptosyltransferase III
LNTVLFIKTKNLGDAVILTAAISAVKQGIAVEILCFEDCRDIYSMVPRVRTVHTVSRGARGWLSIKEHFRLLTCLLSKRYEFVINFSDDYRGAFLAWVLRPNQSVAYKSARRHRLWQKFYTQTLSRNDDHHAVRRDVALVEALGLSQPGQGYARLHLSTGSQMYDEQNRLFDTPYVVLQFASRWKFKQIEHRTALEVASGLINRGFRVVLTGSDGDRSLNENIANDLRLPGVFVHCTDSTSDFAKLVKNAKAVVTIDSFALHVAQAVDAPVVAIFGPTSERVWGPTHGVFRIVTGGLNFMCRPCGRDGCDGSKKSLCLQEISSRNILDGFDSLAECA